MRLLLGMQVLYQTRRTKRLQLKLKYLRWFLDTIIQMRVWPIRRTSEVNPFDVPRTERPPAGTLHSSMRDLKVAHSPRFLLTRYKLQPGRSRGPVMLAPGFGMSTYAFYAAGNDSFAEHLHRAGYDVWLFDYRASDRLDASFEQFTVDDLALEDFPDAIDAVYKATNRRVRIVAHCVASLTMQMALLAGTIDTRQLDSLVLSQSFAFIDQPWINQMKVRLRLPELLAYLNFRPVVTATYDLRSSFRTQLLDRILYFYPSQERCHEGVCRRLLFMYGDVVRHDQLDQRTHRMLYDLFDRGNLTTMKHIAKMIAKGRIVDSRGRNTYLRPENGHRINIPITLLQGTANGVFRASGADKTHEWLVKHGGFGSSDRNQDMFTLLKTPGYGHLDNFIGKNARFDVFPKVTDAFESMDEKLTH